MGTYVAAELGHDLEQRNLTEVARLAGHVRTSHDVEALGLAHVGVVSDHRSRIQVVEHRVFALLDRELDAQYKASKGDPVQERTTTARESQRAIEPASQAGGEVRSRRQLASQQVWWQAFKTSWSSEFHP